MKIVRVDVPFVCAAELVPVRVVAEGFGFIRVGDQARFVRNRIDAVLEVPRGTVVGGRVVDPMRIARTSTAPHAHTSAPRFASPGLIFDRGDR